MAKGSSSYDDFNNLMSDLEQNKIAPVYLLHGEEYYFLEKLIEKIESVVVDEATKSFNHHVFYGKEGKVEDILNVARRFPMMAEKQLVVYKEAQYCRTPEEIVPYLDNPVESTVLVWYHPGAKMPMNRKAGMAFKKKAKVYTAAPIHENSVTPLINGYIKDKGYDIEPRPLQLLVGNSGSQFSLITQELDKVFSNLPEGSKIREEHIEKYVGINKDFNVFSLQDAIAKNNNAKSIEIMHFLAAHMKENPLEMIIGALFSFFRKVAIMQSMARSTDKEIMSAIGIPFFALSNHRQAANRFRGRKMMKVVECLSDADLKAKGIKDNTGAREDIFREMILKILAL